MHTTQVFGTAVHVVDGDIARIHSDALLTAINSLGMWYGGIDRVINQYAGGMFHKQAVLALENDPSTKVIVAPRTDPHDGFFTDVVFTIDDLHEDLEKVVRRGLDAAASAGYRKVTMPAIRLGVMRNIRGTQSEKVASTVAAIRGHIQESETKLNEISIVIYNDLDLLYKFELALR